MNAGKHATVLSWLDRFPDEVLDTNAHLFLIKAWVLSLCGKRAETAEAIAALEALGGPAEGRLPDGFSSIEASLATLRACMPWGDRGSGLANARRAAELEGPGSRYRPVACWAMGMGLYFGGEAEEADRWFAESAELAPESDMWLVAASPLAYRSLVAGEQGRREEQRALAEQAATVTRERGFEKLSGEVLAALGVSLAWDSRFEEALPLLERGVALLRSYGQPIDLANALICQARVLRASGDYEAATAAIAEARATVDSCPDPGALEEWVSALETPPRSPSQHMSSALSEREIAVLRALTGPLSERDIGRELYLSHNTVHSHARSIYRKLGVSSRAEATRRGRELGLL